MTNEIDLRDENEIELIGYKNWLDNKRIREKENLEIKQLRYEFNILTHKVSLLEKKISQLNNEF